jgi:hypothetical protein
MQAGQPEEPLRIVRTAASRLVDDLQRAEELTGGWSDEQLAVALVDAALSQCLSRLAETQLWGEANRPPSGELWRIAGSLLEVGALQHAARFKPRGYAGDFELLARICENYRCEHPLGRAFDAFFQSQAAPQAVRARTEQTAAAIVSDCLARDRSGYHVVSVGAGPALDVRRALAVLPARRRSDLRVTLLDLDPDALDFACSQLEPLLLAGANTAVDCIRTNLFRLPQRADPGVALEAPDFLACTGLFDYLAEEPAATMLRWFWEQLAPGGLLLVGNFAPHNPTRAYMEWIGNWYLIYRTVPEMRELAARAGIPADRVTIGCERLGVDLFLVATKRES